MSNFAHLFAEKRGFRVRFPGDGPDDYEPVEADDPCEAAEKFAKVSYDYTHNEAVMVEVLAPLPGGECWLTYLVEPDWSVTWNASLVQPKHSPN